MAKKKAPPDVESLRKAIARFTKQADRGTVLVAGAWLDDALEACIRAAMRPDRKVQDDIFQPDGPLGSFSARINLAYLLDLIGPTIRHDLEIIRKIRNSFAHTRDELRFTSPVVRDRCKELHAVAACRAGGWILRSAREQFLITAYFLSELLLSLTEPRERNPLLDRTDAYGAWIRHTVKHITLLGLQRELEKVSAK